MNRWKRHSWGCHLSRCTGGLFWRQGWESELALEEKRPGMKELPARTRNLTGEGRTSMEKTLPRCNAQARGDRTLHNGWGQSEGCRRFALGNFSDFGNGLGKSDHRVGLSAAIFENPASEPDFDFGLDPFLHHFAQLFTQIRDLIQSSELKRFERNFRSASEVLDRRFG